MKSKVYKGDCRDSMLAMRKDSVDAIMTDPPYGMEFMGRGWDHGVPGRSFWSAALRVAKPGAFLFAFGGTRLHHRMTCAIEDAGWEIRDCLMWLYGSGFPKSLDVSRAIDAAVGAERTVPVGEAYSVPNAASVNPHFIGIAGKRSGEDETREYQPLAPASPLAQQFDGYGTALKPAWEPIILAMKPIDGTFAENAQRHGLAGLNVDAGRIGEEGGCVYAGNGGKPAVNAYGDGLGGDFSKPKEGLGRWPANVALDEEAAAVLGETARYFYSAKASKRDRTYVDAAGNDQVSDHPTVKPIDLMRWLVRMAAPPRSNVRILDPFMGSGSTGVACALEGVAHFVGCERVDHFIEIAEARIAAAVADSRNLYPEPNP